MYHLLACQPIKGPKLRIPIPDSLSIENSDPMLPAIDRTKNYDKVDIDMLLFQTNMVIITILMNLGTFLVNNVMYYKMEYLRVQKTCLIPVLLTTQCQRLPRLVYVHEMF